MNNPTDTRLRDEDEPSAIAAGESPGRDGIAAGEPGTGEPEDDTEAITRTYGKPSRTIPLVLLAAVGGYIIVERRSFGVVFQLPPRMTRSIPSSGPLGSVASALMS